MIGALIQHGAIALQTWHPPQIVIDAPNYTYLHSGVRCLHVLCDRLNALGISAAVTARRVDPRTKTPQVSRVVLRWMPSMLDQSVVIYPEVTGGNPLRASRVVRYLLNKPGYFDGRESELLESYGAGDYFIHFAEEFRPASLKSTLLRIPLIDTSVFTPPAPGDGRSGFLVYSHRHHPDVKNFPRWVEPISVVSWQTPRDPLTLANLYRRSRALIVGERTAAIPEALHCHCPVILLPHSGFDHEPVVSYFGGHGIVFGFDRDGLARATQTAPAFPSHYAAQFVDVDRRTLDCMADVGRYFGLRDLQVVSPQTKG